MDTPQLLTIEEVATLLRCHRNTIYRMLNEGRLPACRIGRRILFDKGKVLERLAQIEAKGSASEGGGK